MAAVNVKGVVATAVAAGGLSNKVLRGLIDGRVKAMIDTYVTDGTEGVGSTIKMGQVLPPGANVLGVHLIGTGALTAATISVGDSASAARYISASTAFQAAAASVLANLGAGRVVGTTSGDDQILLTTAGATLLTGVTLTALILYTND